MALNEILTLMLIEAHESEEWEYDHNTTVLLIAQRNLGSLLQAVMLISEDLKHLEKISTYGLVSGLTEILEWLINNMEMVKNNGEK